MYKIYVCVCVCMYIVVFDSWLLFYCCYYNTVG